LDIAERGRSLGAVLFGAEQFVDAPLATFPQAAYLQEGSET